MAKKDCKGRCHTNKGRFTKASNCKGLKKPKRCKTRR
jgi:hypothetical protein